MGEKKLIIHPQKYTSESKVISMRLPTDMLMELDRVAKEAGRTRNEIMQLSLEFALENMVIEE
ncbi:MAG: CopG family transcriptional regulator [Lachnospiraceae bacterium]|nr:CopG family transcriptional regulator [Lachnospiraceae bacterium]MDE7444833.1 CopG family transcriptional regulator [Lachnospiraceae bacterium]